MSENSKPMNDKQGNLIFFSNIYSQKIIKKLCEKHVTLMNKNLEIYRDLHHQDNKTFASRITI